MVSWHNFDPTFILASDGDPNKVLAIAVLISSKTCRSISLCIFSYFFKCWDCVKLLKHHDEHWNSGFSPLYTSNGFSSALVLLCVYSIVFKAFECEKLLSHFEHWQGFSPVCVHSCVFKAFECGNLLSTLNLWMVSRLCGSSHVSCIWSWEALVTLWALKWFLSCVGSLMCLQVAWIWHKWLFACVSPFCVFKALECEKLLSHVEHWNGFSPVCVLSCGFKEFDCEKLLPHYEHWNYFSPVWVL